MSELTQHIKTHDKLGLPGEVANALSPSSTMVVIGDSWARQDEHADPTDTPSNGIARNLNSLMGNFFEIINIAGVGGERLDEIQARFSTDVIAYNPTYCILIGGENDIGQDRTAAQMWASTKLMIDAAIAAGIIIIVLPAQPMQGAFSGDDTASTQLRVDQWGLYNRELLTYSMQQPSFIYASKAYESLLKQDYTDAFSVYMPTPEDVYRLDNSHINSAGALMVAKSIKSQIESAFPEVDMFPRHYNDLGAGCWNPMMKVTGTPSTAGIGAGSDGITNAPPEGWYAKIQGAGTGVAVASQVARTDVNGAYWARFVCTNMQTAQYLRFLESETSAFNYNRHLLSDHGLAVGDIVEFYCEIKIHDVSDGAAGNGELNNITMKVNIEDSTNAEVSTLQANRGDVDADVYHAADMEDEIRVFSTIRHTLAATSHYFRIGLNAYIQTGASGDTDFTIDFGRIGVRKIA